VGHRTVTEHTQAEVLFTVVAAISAGVILIAIARRLDFSTIALLLLGGAALGPNGLGVLKPDRLREGLPVFVSFSIGLILFEGGLTLDLKGYRAASRIIVRLLTVGLLTTWFATAAAIWLILGFPPGISLVAASLVIVTGPTVIVPLLKRIRIQQPLHNILHWEGVLIDPIGVFIAVLCLESISGLGAPSAAMNFVLRLLSGLGIGAAGGVLLSWLMRSGWIDDELIDIVPLAVAAAVFGLAEAAIRESGLLAAATAGFVLGASRPIELERIRRFKAAISDLLIGMVFVLLAARLSPVQFVEFGWKGLVTVALVVFVVRLLNVTLSTLGEPLNWRQRGFLAWVAPRGIVAASMSSLIALRLEEARIPNARFVETFTYSVIVITVLLQGLTASWLARRLGLRRPEATGWLIVGAHLLGRKVAEFISRTARVPVALLDLNPKEVDAARQAGLIAMVADARDTTFLDEHPEIQTVGNLLAVTDNEDLNSLLCQRWAEVFGKNRVFGWQPKRAANRSSQQKVGSPIWRQLPKPSIISGDLERRAASLTDIALSDVGGEAPRGTLIVAGPSSVALDLLNLQKGGDAGTFRCLALERRGSHLVSAMHRELFVTTRADSMAQLIHSLVDRLVHLVPRLPADEVIRELTERERVFSSAIGHGVAIPHAYSKSAVARMCVLAQLPDGMEHSTPDGEPLRLVFLIVGPPGDPEGHLALIAEIAGLVSDDTARERLLRAGSFDDLIAFIQETPGTSV